MSPRFRPIATVLLLVVGLQLSLIAASPYWPPRNLSLIALASCVVVCLIPLTSRAVDEVLARLSSPSPATRAVTFIFIVLASTSYLYLDASHQQRDFHPKYQDEYSYLLQTRMLSSGRLWLPAPAHPHFFESFQVVTEPVYASVYFPGAAMLYVPGQWLQLPAWAMPLLLSGLSVGMMYVVFTRLTDGVGGLLGALMLIGLPIFRKQSIMFMAQVPVLLLILVAVWGWLNWRRDHSIRWSIVTGAAIGWAMITRPLDGLCAALPIAIAMLMENRSLRAIVPAVIASLPFAVVQLCFNVAVTGSALQTPFSFYAERSLPQTSLGFHGFDEQARPQSVLPQKHAYYDRVARPFIISHTPVNELRIWTTDRLPQMLREGSPAAPLIVLVPVGLLMLTCRARWIGFLVAPMFCVLYFFYPFRLPHYLLTALPSVLLLIVLGAYALPRAARSFAVLSIITLTICQLPEFTRARDDLFAADEHRSIDSLLAGISDERAIVLFRFSDGCNPEIEPVYNLEAVQLSGNRVLRAHDLGERNRELLGAIEPDRMVYRFDRATGELSHLGRAGELVAR